MISALRNRAEWNNGRTQNTNQQREQNTTHFKGKKYHVRSPFLTPQSPEHNI